MKSGWLKKDQTVFWVHLTAAPAQDADGQPAYQVVLSDISQRVQAEKKMLEIEEKYRLVAENSTDLIMLHNLKGGSHWVSPSVMTILGYEPDELLRLNILDIFLPDDKESVIKPVIHAMNEGEQFDVSEFRVHRKNGEVLWLEARTTPIKSADGSLVGILTTAREITKRKTAENLIRIQHDMGIALSLVSTQQEALEIILKAVKQIEPIDSGGIYLVDAVSGDLNLAEHAGLQPFFIEAIASVKADTPSARLVMAAKPMYTIVPEFKDKDESLYAREGLRAAATIPISHNGRVIAAFNLASHTTSDIPVSVRGVLESISLQIGNVVARVMAEKAVRELEEKYRLVVDNSADLIALLQFNPKKTWISPTVTSILGYSPEEMEGQSIYDLIDPYDLENIVKPASEITAREKTSSQVEYRIRKKDGRIIWMDTTVKPITNADGMITGILTTSRDTTARKTAENLIRIQRDLGMALSQVTTRQEALTHILEAVLQIEPIDSGGIYLVDPASGALNLSAHIGLGPFFVQEVSYYAADEPNVRQVMQGQPLYLSLPSTITGDEDMYAREGLRSLAVVPVSHEGQIIAALNIASHSGSEIPQSSRVVLESIASQVGSVVMRVQAETALRESEVKYRVFFENEVYAICIFDSLTQRILDSNNAFTSLYGYTRADLEAGVHIAVIGASSPESVEKTIQTLAQGQTFIPMRKHRNKDGRVFPVEVVGGPYTWRGQAVSYVMTHDISVRIEAEQKVRQSELDLRKAQQIAKMGSWKYNLRNNRLELSEAFYEVLQFKKTGEPLELNQVIQRVIHPDDRQRLAQNIKNIVDGGAPSHQEYRAVMPDKSEKVLSFVVGEMILDQAGKPVDLVGIAQDITERKLMEAQLEESEKRYREMVERQGEGIYTTDRDATFLFANPTAEALFGAAPGTLVGRRIAEFTAPGQEEIIGRQTALRELKQDGSYELKITHPDGSEHILLITATARLDEQSNHIGTMAICRDMTQRKQEEDKLRFESTHDALTGLYNRAYFEETQILMKHRRQFPVSIVMIDVDNLKMINDNLGHQAGDRLLQAVAATLQSSIRESDTAARVGGDEFTLMLPYADQKNLDQVLKRIEKKLEAENTSGLYPFEINISMGWSTCHEPETLSERLKEADEMMYRNKAARGAGRDASAG